MEQRELMGAPLRQPGSSTFAQGYGGQVDPG